ncbi:hypothetical protein A5731_18585 [Mycolicibacterium conceptionense]|uniref:Uncharacterized protein n=1 Tax=Mycolicibacterium wolinskyi TaxID=59750 RepID=A0A1X2FBY1_9MYCO|nr:MULTISPECIES: hypothetical protein [Mycolicibacterium]MBN3459743.1 hypothetical protein [Mycobacterium sp. DSM 3803]MCV7283845.1 hypothetical protein [Mycolicibacterium wolinskyi]MCV7297279.1 hypothetical protein [Mycolicibacterium goodii]OBB05379.1 hypothetical protein A5718_22885 [Mycolicibacterium conceptionense]OBF01282.1 hypothetical protein A5731_18585 [Mycolicibacterium conceptionense]
MSINTATGRARHLGDARNLVHRKSDGTVVDFFGQADLYLLTPPLRGYTTVVVSSTDRSGQQTDFGPETLIFGLEGEGLLYDADDVGGGRGILTATEALEDAGYTLD